MPTENRSSTIEQHDHIEGIIDMVSVPRVLTREMLNGVCMHPDLARSLWSALLQNAPQPTPQPHPDPIAWMVGTAIWWTKEEAARDAAATGLPIVGLGPMPTTASTKQRQGEPVAWLAKTLKGSLAGTLGLARYNQRLNPELYDGPFPVFRHADAGEVERLNDALEELRKAYTELEAQVDSDFKVIDDLRAQQAERDELLRDLAAEDIPLRVAARIEDALSASAGPSSPTWSCQACQVEQPTDRACDACGGKTELAGAKS